MSDSPERALIDPFGDTLPAPGATLEVDCGICDDATKHRWEQVFDRELHGLPVLRIIITHMHPGHIGLAHWLTERWSTPGRDCRLWISATDWHAAHMATRVNTGHGGDAAADFFARHGLRDADLLAQVQALAGEGRLRTSGCRRRAALSGAHRGKRVSKRKGGKAGLTRTCRRFAGPSQTRHLGVFPWMDSLTSP